MGSLCVFAISFELKKTLLHFEQSLLHHISHEKKKETTPACCIIHRFRITSVTSLSISSRGDQSDVGDELVFGKVSGGRWERT
jgi:hypothetical protein